MDGYVCCKNEEEKIRSDGVEQAVALSSCPLTLSSVAWRLRCVSWWKSCVLLDRNHARDAEGSSASQNQSNSVT